MGLVQALPWLDHQDLLSVVKGSSLHPSLWIPQGVNSRNPSNLSGSKELKHVPGFLLSNHSCLRSLCSYSTMLFLSNI